jgi:hypothetical protein
MYLNDKCVSLSKDTFIVGTNCIAGFINDIINFEKSKKNQKIILIPELKYNCFFKRFHHKIFVITKKEIKEEEEIFI